MNTLFESPLAKLAVLGLMLAVSGQALADRDYGWDHRQVTKKIDVSDVDFSNLRDVEVLYDRIDTVARRVCRIAIGRISNAKSRDDWKECVGTAVEKAVLSANSPTLTAVHRGASERLAGLGR